MKIAVRCIYYRAVTPNFLVIDLNAEAWSKFLWADNKTRIEMIRPYLPKDHPTVREATWISIGDLSTLSKETLIINLL